MSDTRVTVHIVANAHLDPVWLWPWQAGLDEVLATCRTMCDLLDEHPDAIFSAGEAWRYQQLAEVDPALLERVRAHVAAGRWEIVGGWWIQPDCNFPSGFAFARQIAVGERFLRDRFGSFPEVAYNVDSFGHAASLPGYLRAAGQRYYVMMRPQEHEMALPARCFRWRGFADGPEVLTFRIAGAYGSWGPTPTVEHVRNALSALPPGARHTMCFIGIGDHGGGPSANALAWVRQNAEAIAGCRLVFSSPARFFQAVAAEAEAWPLVTGELQMHAVGCYSVVRGIKAGVRRAEHLLRQVEIVAPAAPALESAWQDTAFNHFHDILGGTCLPSADRRQVEQLGGIASYADTVLQQALRRRLPALPPDPLARIVLLNASDSVYDGYLRHEPWLPHATLVPGTRWTAGCRLLDEDGRAVPYQALRAEAVNGGGLGWSPALLWRTRLEPGQLRVFRLDPQPGEAPAPAVQPGLASLANDCGCGVDLGLTPSLSLGPGLRLPLPRLDLVPDGSDNWSHSLDRFAEGPVLSPLWNASCLLDSGPLMASLLRTGRLGDSLVSEEWRVYAGEPFVELRLTVNWREAMRLLKLVCPFPAAAAAERLDGIPGAALARPNNGREVPVQDWSRLSLPQGQAALVSPDVYALDATPWRARFTLLRSPILTQHDPPPYDPSRAVYADQGEHLFRIRFYGGAALAPDFLTAQALMLHRPVLVADHTRGMPRA